MPEPLIDRQRVAELVRATVAELSGPRPALPDPRDAVLLAPDRGANLAAFDADALKGMLASTPARIGVGRAGTRYRTNTLLRFRADHAAAKDAVLSEVDAKLVEKLGLVELTTRAPDKRIFLERPDAGRALSDESKTLLAQKCARSPQVQVCYGDGLSAAALNAHLEAFHGALTRELAARGLRAGTPVFVRRSRVKVMDEIARLLDAEACVFTCGERPGLGFSDSMSAYYIYRPASGATDADREVVSNINPRGFEPVKAAQVVADACARVLRDKKSGVIL
jgi:ethanolamine ammonia-lyase small subunit